MCLLSLQPYFQLLFACLLGLVSDLDPLNLWPPHLHLQSSWDYSMGLQDQLVICFYLIYVRGIKSLPRCFFSAVVVLSISISPCLFLYVACFFH
jgi:hypothetical protein